MKIDVEGAELEALVGMRSTLEEHGLPPILCEVLDADQRADMAEHDARLAGIERLLQDLGYSIERVVKEGAVLAARRSIRELPRRRWTPSGAEDCDYLFVASNH